MSAPTRRQKRRNAATRLVKRIHSVLIASILLIQRRTSLTGSKRLPAARNHDAADVVVLVEHPRGVNQVLEKRIAEGVEGLRTMEGDDAYSPTDDVAIFREATLDQDVVVVFL